MESPGDTRKENAIGRRVLLRERRASRPEGKINFLSVLHALETHKTLSPRAAVSLICLNNETSFGNGRMMKEGRQSGATERVGKRKSMYPTPSEQRPSVYLMKCTRASSVSQESSFLRFGKHLLFQLSYANPRSKKLYNFTILLSSAAFRLTI